MLASLKEKFTCRELDYFLEAKNNILEEDNLMNKAIRDIFALFWNVIVLLAENALSYFWEWDLRAFFYLPCIIVFIVTFLVIVINNNY